MGLQARSPPPSAQTEKLVPRSTAKRRQQDHLEMPKECGLTPEEEKEAEEESSDDEDEVTAFSVYKRFSKGTTT